MDAPETETATVPATADAIIAAARALGPEIEAAATELDTLRRLPDPIVEALRAAGVFRIAFPAAWGGPEMAILDQARLIETIAYHDASTAWVAMICSDSGHYAARLDEAIARELYPSLDLLTAGFLYPVGQARKVDGGFRVSGRWQFGSGCLHADRIVGGCMLLEDDAPVIGADGLPEVMVVFLPRDGVVIHDTWHTTGLAGTGSNDYSVTDVFVPDGHHFDTFRVGDRPEPLYRYHGFFFANLPAVAIGCAQRMIDDLRELARTKVSLPAMVAMKEEYRVRIVLADVTARIAASRLYQDATLSAIWDRLVRGEQPTREQRAAVSFMSMHVIRTAHEIAESVCDAVGGQSIFRDSPFERRRRDLTTMTAHVVGQPKAAATAVSLLFDEEPRFSFV